MSDRIRLLIVEREPLYRRGVMAALEGAANVVAADQCGTLAEGLRLIATLTPDLVLVGTTLPDAPGFAAAAEVRRRFPDLPMVVVGETAWDDDVLAAARSGASAYAGKDVAEARLLDLIARVAAGEAVIREQLPRRPGATGRAPGRGGGGAAGERTARSLLTGRELQVLRGISGGRTNAEIGDELGISAQTVKNHVTAILRKLGVNDRTQAVVFALRQGWIAIEEVPAAPPLAPAEPAGEATG